MRSRSRLTFREVITSRPPSNAPIEISWEVGLTIFFSHLLNKLMDEGYSVVDAYDRIHSKVHDEHLEGLLVATITECNTETGSRYILVREK